MPLGVRGEAESQGKGGEGDMAGDRRPGDRGLPGDVGGFFTRGIP
jgi:hypothetical protein